MIAFADIEKDQLSSTNFPAMNSNNILCLFSKPEEQS